MKKLFLLSAMALTGFGIMAQQDKSKRPSPPANVSETTEKGVTITIDYSQPSVKGRTIGKDIAPYGKVWRTGANEPTTIEVSKDVQVEGQHLPAGKYSLYSIPGADEWTIIINKKTTGWGTQYDESQDALRIKVKPGKAPQFTEKMTFTISKSGTVSLLWGNEKVDFNVI
jgi:Protein of unknown function (DUF2911).